MSQNESPPWGTWRITRLLKILDYKAQGLTDAEVAERMPISRATVSRELNSPQAAEIGQMLRRRAEGMVWPLVEKQLNEIESLPLKPGQKLTYRGKIIDTLTRLLPRQIEQKLEATGDLRFVLEAWRPEKEEEEKKE